MGAGYDARMELLAVSEDRGFSRLREEWNALLAVSAQDGPFLRHEWLEGWWGSFRGSDDRLRVLTCRDEAGALVGVLPAYETRIGRFLGAHVVRLLGDEHVGSVGLGAFAHPDAEGQVAERLLGHLRGDRGWDVLDFRALDARGPFFERIGLQPDSGAVRTLLDAEACPQVTLPTSWESYVTDVLGSHSRRAVRQSRRDAEELGARLEVVDDPARIPQALEDLLRLFECRMQRVLDPRFEVSPGLRAFVARMLPALLAQGSLRLAFLTIDGRRVAVEYGFRYLDTLYGLMSGFEARWARHAVYKALFGYVVERAIGEGCLGLDLGLGDQGHKREWGVSEVRRFSDVSVYSGSVAARVRRAEDRAVLRAERVVLASPAWLMRPLMRAGKAARRFARRR